MPSIFSHAAFAVLGGRGFLDQRFAFWLLAGFCAIAPDFDGVAFVFRIPYANLFGHRGITHSIAFAILLGAVAAAFAIRFLKTKLSFSKLWLFFSLATVSHPLLDMLTNGGLGVALFAPFTNTRYFFPWRPIEVSPIGAGFFSSRGVAVFLSELLWVWTPALVVMLAAKFIRKK